MQWTFAYTIAVTVNSNTTEALYLQKRITTAIARWHKRTYITVKRINHHRLLLNAAKSVILNESIRMHSAHTPVYGHHRTSGADSLTECLAPNTFSLFVPLCSDCNCLTCIFLFQKFYRRAKYEISIRFLFVSFVSEWQRETERGSEGEAGTEKIIPLFADERWNEKKTRNKRRYKISLCNCRRKCVRKWYLRMRKMGNEWSSFE